jgi:hypothetical protein
MFVNLSLMFVKDPEEGGGCKFISSYADILMTRV